MSRYPFPSRARRRGQALLLAVLIMIFAALLSASFLVVVSVNLNQTARQSDKNRAVASAKAGLSHVNSRLTYSAEGERWRGELENVPPAPGDATYNFYYTPLDIAQGWARTTPHPTTDLNGDTVINELDERIVLDAARAQGKLEMVKSPDPRTNSESDPQYLSTIQRVPLNLPPTHPEFDKVGALRITVVGLSAEDPTAYNRSVVYKGGFNRSPLARIMRVVGNYDFKNNVVPVAQVSSYDATDAAAPKIIFQSTKDSFYSMAKPFASAPVQPFTIAISNPKSVMPAMGVARSAVVRDVTVDTTTTPPTYTLVLAPTATALNPLPAPGDRVELAANLGAPSGINYDNDPTTADTALSPALAVRLSDGAVVATTNQVDSARVNAGLTWSGDLLMQKLRPYNRAFGASPPSPPGTPVDVPGTIQASGVIALDNTTAAPTVNVAQVDGSNTDTLTASSATGIFGSAPSTQDPKYQLAADGWDRIKGVPSTSGSLRSVTEFRPPDIASGAQLARYRDMARFAKPVGNLSGTVPAQTNGGLYGFAEDIYIDNTQDREKIYSPTAPVGLREMTQAELIQMWLSKAPTLPALPADFTRTGVPLAPTDANASLEQQHLRGWVGPDEFRPRGVSITLNSNTTPPSITITRDARDDSPARNLGGALNKTWKDPATAAEMRGVYSQTLPWPVHGVIFAEGNVRISGTVTNAPRSLTVVSMNNIYIENSLNAAPYKVLLMARRNVVMNPTRVMGRPDEQTLSLPAAPTAVTAGTPVTLDVADASTFNIGDFIQTSTLSPGTEVVTTQGYVTAAPAAPFKQISFTPTASGTINTNDLLRTPSPIIQSVPSTVVGRNIAFTPVASVNDAFQRNIVLPNPLPTNVQLANLRLAFNHQAERIGAFTVATTGTRPNPILFSNKGVFTVPPATTAPFLNHGATVASQAEKQIRVDFQDPGTGGSDLFPGTVATNASAPTYPTNNAEANDTTRNVGAISAAMNATGHPDNIAGTDWNYTTTVPTVNAVPTAYANVPFYYLAGVSNRTDFAPPAPLVELRKDIGQAQTVPYEVPIGTSISLFLSGAPTFAEGEVWNTTYATPAYEKTGQFGFNPSFEDVGTPPIPSEDILTSDQSFYQTPANIQNTTIDSRRIPGLTIPTTVGFQSNPFTLRRSANLAALPAQVKYPDYRVMGLKLENVALTANSSTIASIDTAYTFDVNAYVYAQTGSWFVIPGPMFDERLRGTNAKNFLDLNNNNTPETGEFLDTNTNNIWDDGECADLNRNNLRDDAELRAMTRYSRFNYQINFTGAIAENQTALVNDVGTGATQVSGAVADWMNKWATTKFDGTTATPTFTDGRMQYFFDPTVAQGITEDNPTT
ncbi:MAG TPA: hypothetical protein VF627_02010, partial [Abditibacterium sp.]